MATYSSILVMENALDKGAWKTTVHRIAKSRTWTEATSHTHTQRLYNEKSEVLANKQTKRVKYEASK